MKLPVNFYSEGHKISADLYLPRGISPEEKRSGVVICHGYTGVKDLYLPDIARYLNKFGYVAITFDYKGWGSSEGPRNRLAPYSRVADTQAAMTFLGLHPNVNSERIGIMGVSYGGATVTWVGAIDPRAKCIISVMGIGHGSRWMSRVRRPDEWHDMLERSIDDRNRRVKTGESKLAPRSEILMADRVSSKLATEQRNNNEDAVDTIPWEFVDDTLGFNPEWIVNKISPRPILFITSDNDRTVLPEESESLYSFAKEPKKLVVLDAYSHYAIYTEPALKEVMSVSSDWLQQWLPCC